ncbi:beta-ketoacyl synthase N-terminal-like domain-containing protein [Treponema sp.]|uniref:beta-ketoacyl synthase N-terminal-like domain-containing protein n=1 Tax=Treponema sp. TaxID=166 RepID=UPI00298D85AE|nr:beta-ketoacyl synthase N-terminal-like domain-containing protein [Treponema sp.]MCR5614238.1 3-oxoacyl-ACP synthase [Treponema sp.]
MNQGLYLSHPGVICAAGANAEKLWECCFSGNQDGLKKVKAVSGKEFYAGRIDDSLLKPAVNAKYDMRIIRILDAALAQIKPVVDEVKAKYGDSRIGVCLGSCDNGSEFSLKAHRAYFADGKFPAGYELEVQGADYPATFVKEACGVTGPAFVFSTACSSSGSALVKAREMIEAGIIDAAIVGGVDIASDTVLLGFDSLEAVSDKKANPFSANRNGITLGEGAALFVLSRDKGLVTDEGFSCVLLGCGESADASHMTAPLEDGSGAAQAISAALTDASLKTGDIDYINLHGTGTHLNDSMEAKAVKTVFGELAEKIPVSTTKPLTGHTLGAAASIELAICYMALKNSACKKLPVQVWDKVREDGMPYLNFVDDGFEVEKEIKTAMSNSFGFGGCNISLIIGKE